MGQDAPEVRFKARSGASTLYLTDADAVLVGRGGDAVRWRLVGADPQAEVVGLDERPGVANYYRGTDPSAWRAGIPTFGRVVYKGAYPGIDAVFYGSQTQFEYDLVVAPEADVRRISFGFDNSATPRIDESGDLVLELAKSQVRHRRPVAYQDSVGGRHEVEADYVLRDGAVGLIIGAYDHTLPLVIDPLIYSTFIGGDQQDDARSIAVNSAGEVVITGRTQTNYPTRNAIPSTGHDGFDDAYVTKFNAAGTDLIYSTYLTSTTPKQQPNDVGRGVVLDAVGSAYVLGVTNKGFPTTAGAFQSCPEPADPTFNDQDAFVVKLSPTGSLSYATCLGGSDTEDPGGIAVDATGNAVVTGTTYSTNFPVTNSFSGGGAFHGPEFDNDAFVAKLNSTGTGLVYSSYLGGASGGDIGKAVGLDLAGNAYVYGTTFSSDFPTASALDSTLGGSRDMFVTKLTPSGGSLVYSSYIGGSANDGETGSSGGPGGFVVDPDGNAYLASFSNSTDFPITPLAFQGVLAGGNDIVIAKLTPSGQNLAFSTYLGGSANDGGTKVGLAVDGQGNVYVVSNSLSTNFPIGRADPVTVAPPGTLASHAPQVVAKLSADGSTLISSTYFGLTLNGFSSIAVDAAQNIYIAGETRSASFPITPGAYQTVLTPSTLANQNDIFVSKLDPIVGFIRVTTDPPLPSQISVDGTARATYGIINMEASPGSHDVCFREVEGYITPACQTVAVTKGATTVVAGAFVAKGFLQVQTSPATPAKISVDGVARDDWGIFTDFAVGSHQVCFGPVADLVPPSCQTVNVTAGATTPVTGTYAPSPGASGEPAGNGALRVTTSPALPSQITVDGVPRATYGLINLQIAPGSHQLCFRAVEGFASPACQDVVVNPGLTTQAVGTFVARGFLQAVSSPALPVPVYVDGLARDDWGLFTDYPIGAHQVCFGSVARKIRPACQNVTLVAGSTATATGSFAPA